MHESLSIANEFYADTLSDAEKDNTTFLVMNRLGRQDLFFLLTNLMNRVDIINDWLYERCVDVQLHPDGMLDLWAREHYKSTLITFGKSIQDILDSHSKDSFHWAKEVCIGIFSHTRPIAKAFLSQIMLEFENNELLKQVYPDVLWKNPRREADKWSLDNGIIVKRKSNPKEATVEAWGLVDGQPTSKHFDILNYDDIVTKESVTTPDQIKKTTDSLALSYNLGAHGGVKRGIGTRYHFNDSYRTVMARKTFTPRIHAATKNGKAEGEPVYLDRKTLAEKRRDMGPYIFACQMLQDPKAEDAMGFQEPWLRYYSAEKYQKGLEPWPSYWNYYLICDPAGEKKKENDYTVIAVVALAPDRNYYLVDAIRDRMNLKERTAKMFEFHRKYNIKKAGYEKYGKDSDIEHIEEMMDHENYRFEIIPLGGAMPKNDRIRKLVPVFEQGRFYLPYRLLFFDYEGNMIDFVRVFKDDEYLPFPVAVHDDMLDDLSRIRDEKLEAEFPMEAMVKSTAGGKAKTEYNMMDH